MNLLGSYNMKKLKFNTFVLALFLTVSFSAKAIPTPEAVEPQYDDDGNTMFGATMYNVKLYKMCARTIMMALVIRLYMRRRELISFYKSGEFTKGDKALTIR